MKHNTRITAIAVTPLMSKGLLSGFSYPNISRIRQRRSPSAEVKGIKKPLRTLHTGVLGWVHLKK